jgi:hypothetical protein
MFWVSGLRARGGPWRRERDALESTLQQERLRVEEMVEADSEAQKVSVGAFFPSASRLFLHQRRHTASSPRPLLCLLGGV